MGSANERRDACLHWGICTHINCSPVPKPSRASHLDDWRGTASRNVACPAHAQRLATNVHNARAVAQNLLEGRRPAALQTSDARWPGGEHGSRTGTHRVQRGSHTRSPNKQCIQGKPAAGLYLSSAYTQPYRMMPAPRHPYMHDGLGGSGDGWEKAESVLARRCIIICRRRCRLHKGSREQKTKA